MQRVERPAIEHQFISPAPSIDGCSLVSSVETNDGRLLEEWFCLDEGAIFRTCVRDERGWVPYTVSKPVPSGNAWTNNPNSGVLTVDVESRETTSMGDDCLQAISLAFGGKRVSMQPGSSQVFVETEPVREVILSSNLVAMIESNEVALGDLTRYLSDAPPELWLEYGGSYSILIDGSKMRDFLSR